MATLSMNEITTFRWSFEEDVAEYANAGIPAIGVWRQKLSDCGLARARPLLERSGLRVSHLHWAGGFTGSEGRSFRESLDDAADALRTASQLGTKTLVVYSGARAGHTLNHAKRLIQTALRELTPLAEEIGVNLAIEPMHPACATPWTFLTSLNDARELLAAVGSPRMKLVLDTYHLGQDGSLLDTIPEVASDVAIVQLGDARHPPGEEQNRCRLGEGVVPLREIVAALKAADYDGYYDIELLGEDIEPSCYHAILRHARAAFAELIGEPQTA
ncbi:MAG: sugar phosphate isomerase/epimerase family protein [Planctomycetota bacterium]